MATEIAFDWGSLADPATPKDTVKVPVDPPAVRASRQPSDEDAEVRCELTYDEYLDGLVLPGISDDEYALICMLHGKPITEGRCWPRSAGLAAILSQKRGFNR